MEKVAAEVLISALLADPKALSEQMHLNSPAVLVNQCDKDGKEELSVNGFQVTVISQTGRGVGLSRNTALENAGEDYVLFSDDDIVYDAGYAEKIEKAFEENRDADLLLFNVRVCEERRTYWTDSKKKIGRMNCGRYPAYSIAAKRESLIRAGVKYSLLFGGGARFSNGEDSLFLTDCLRSGLKIYAVPVEIGEETYRESTWFHGFNEKFFYDRGVLFAFLYRGFAPLWAFRFIYLKKNVKFDEVPKKKAYRLIRDGIKEGNGLRK